MILLPLVGMVATGVAFTPFTDTFTTPGASSTVIPVGATSLTVRAWAGGGGGGRGNGAGVYGGAGGGGAGSKKTVAISPSDWGKTISYTVGAAGLGRTGASGDGTPGGATTVTNSGASFPNLNINAGGGGEGGTPSVPGSGGSATGGDVNQTGGTGEFDSKPSNLGGDSGTIDGISGGGGLPGNNPGGGGNGRYANNGGDGASGRVDFVWT